MVRSTAIEIIARHLSLNAGRVSALAQRAAEAGELPKACGRSVPDLAPIGLAKLLLCAICDRGLGNAATSVCEYGALATESGAQLIDLFEGLLSGDVSASRLHSMIVQLEPAAVTIVTGSDRLHYGASREQSAAAHIIAVPGDALRAIVNEFRDLNAAIDRAPIRAAAAALDRATAPARAAASAFEKITAPARAAIAACKKESK